MNNKTINEFGFGRIEELLSADLGGCYPPRPSPQWITPSSICLISLACLSSETHKAEHLVLIPIIFGSLDFQPGNPNR